jgi:hypothetical protein
MYVTTSEQYRLGSKANQIFTKGCPLDLKFQLWMSVPTTRRGRRCLSPTTSTIEATIACFIQGLYTYDATQHTEAGYVMGLHRKHPLTAHKCIGI